MIALVNFALLFQRRYFEVPKPAEALLNLK